MFSKPPRSNTLPGPDTRRRTVRYRKKQRIVRDIWIISGLLMLSMPTGMVYVMTLGTTFLSFMILDETP